MNMETPMETPVEGFKQRLREVMSELGKRNSELAQICGVSDATFSNYKTGKKLPRVETLAKLVITCRLNANWLLMGEGSMFLDKKSGAELVPPLAAEGLVQSDAVSQRLQGGRQRRIHRKSHIRHYREQTLRPRHPRDGWRRLGFPF